MIQSFRDDETRDIFDGKRSNRARRRLPAKLWQVAFRKLDSLNAAHDLRDVAVPPSNRLEKLKGDRRGQHSVRINERYRICFVWTDAGPEDVEVVDYH